MLRATSAALFLTSLTVLPGSATVLQAQKSTTRGFNVGLHASGASLQVEDGDRHNAGGAGLILGYGFNRSVQLFLQLGWRRVRRGRRHRERTGDRRRVLTPQHRDLLVAVT
ncbi:MAG TPA: hypothetical protein VM198_01395 [Longimicrobiales bacterium]|nr:hypothetical protein [Longimicrobiales bacterium]